MSPEFVGLLGVIVMLFLLGTGMWIGLAMGIVGFLGVFSIRGFEQALNMAGSIPYENIAFYTISVMPMFVLMGLVISQTGIGSDLYYSAHKCIGQLRGGLASATVVACAFLSAISGTAWTGIIVFSKTALPEMRKYGYDDGLSTATISCSASMDILIPPSIAFVMYGILTEQSIGKLYIAGILPGVIQALFYMGTIYIVCRMNPERGPAGPKTGLKEKIFSLKNAWATVALFIAVIGGIYLGVFTPTEAGAVGAFGSIVIAAIGRQLTIKRLLDSFKETAVTTGMILLMLVGTFMFMHFMALSRLPFAVSDWVVGLHLPPMVVMIAIILMYLVLGGPLPELPLVMLTIPIIYPLVVAMGFDPIWYGVIIVRMLAIGSISPPVGQNIFLISGLSGVPLSTVYRGVVPFLIADVINVVLLVAFPELSLFLVRMMK
jgi:tripartite ATP-independent transporter DctM subunit